MRLLSEVCEAEFERLADRLSLNSSWISYWSPALAELLFQLTPFFSVLVVLQNSLLGLVSQRIGRPGTIPKSLSKFLAKSTHYPWFDETVLELFQGYWENGGEHLREYRNMDQHYYVLSRHSFIEVAPSPRIRVLLPDDPFVKSAREFTFKSEVNAVAYCEDALARLDELADAVAAHFGFEEAPLGQPINLYQPYQVVEEGEARTVALLVHPHGKFEAVELGQVAGESQVFVKQLARRNNDS